MIFDAYYAGLVFAWLMFWPVLLISAGIWGLAKYFTKKLRK